MPSTRLLGSSQSSPFGKLEVSKLRILGWLVLWDWGLFEVWPAWLSASGAVVMACPIYVLSGFY